MSETHMTYVTVSECMEVLEEYDVRGVLFRVQESMIVSERYECKCRRNTMERVGLYVNVGRIRWSLSVCVIVLE